MGAGKSSVAEGAARELRVAWYDADVELRRRRGILPALLNIDPGEFRRNEAEVLEELLDEEPGVIATGGGIVSTVVGRMALIESGVPVIWLSTPFEVNHARVQQDPDNNRPLFTDPDAARALYAGRRQWYAATATHTVDASLPLKEVIANVVEIATGNHVRTV